MEIRVEPDGAIRILPFTAPPTPANDANKGHVARESRIRL